MPNVFLSGRIPAELHQQIEEFLARTGETKTEMLTRAVATYIGTEPPPLKATGDRRLENLEQEVAELKGAVKSLYEKFATFPPKTENPNVEIQPITICDNATNNNNDTQNFDKIDATFSDIDKAALNNNNTCDNTTDNNDNKLEVSYSTEVTQIIDDEKTFLKVDTAEASKLTKLDSKKFTDLRGAFNRKLKKENNHLPERRILDNPIKMTPPSEVKIGKVPYDIFYVGQSKEGRNLWNLIPRKSRHQQIPIIFPDDNT